MLWSQLNLKLVTILQMEMCFAKFTYLFGSVKVQPLKKKRKTDKYCRPKNYHVDAIRDISEKINTFNKV